MASILAVDDSASMRQMVSYRLESDGYEVVVANDGVEALRIAEETSVNLDLTDVNMSNMDGITRVRELRKLDTYKFKPILVLTTESCNEKKKFSARKPVRLAGSSSSLIPSNCYQPCAGLWTSPRDETKPAQVPVKVFFPGREKNVN